MKGNLFLFLVVILLLSSIVSALPPEKETVVKFSSPQQISSFITDYSLRPVFSLFEHAELAHNIGLDRYYHGKLNDLDIELLKDSGLVESIQQYQDDFSFEYAEEPFSNDPHFPLQYYLHNKGQQIKNKKGVIDADIDGVEALSDFKHKKPVKIGLIDSGVDTKHPDLIENLLSGWDPYLDSNDVLDEYYGHGTHIAGILAASWNNHEGIIGVNPYAKIVPCRITSPGEYLPWVIASCVVFATDEKVDVISMSFGVYTDYDIIQDSIEYAYSSNVVLVGASGNQDTSDLLYPASYSQVISVGATDNTDTIADFSNYGERISLVAPGVDIYSTYPTYFNGSNGYAYMSGTSMATPQVAAVASMLKSARPDLTNYQIWGVLEKSADDLGIKGRDDHYGQGRLNAKNALDLING